MKEYKWGFVLILILLLAACQVIPVPVTILVDDTVVTLKTNQRIPAEILAEAGIFLGPEDRILYQGNAISSETELPGNMPITLSIHRASVLIINRSDGQTWTLTSSAETIGEAFEEAGLVISTSDLLEPSAETPLTGTMTVSWQPAVDIIISIGKVRFQARSSAETVGNALADSGFPLIGLDYCIPPENTPIPADGQLRIIRVEENISLTTKSLPFGTRTELSAELEIDQKALLQGGVPGLAIARIRTRSEDGEEVYRLVESESLVTPPQDQILGIGTQIVIRTAVVDGVTIEYWRALNLFTSVFIPDGVHIGTASGTLIRKGAVAMVYPWYLLFAGERLYIPGYGFGTVEDNNGALTNALGDTYWLDLGYGLEDVIDWTNRYVTVYFLTPVPANVADTYILP